MHEFKFVPLVIPQENPKDTYQKVKDDIGKMETKRNWNDYVGILGKQNAKLIESILRLGGTVADIGAGQLISASELATNFANGFVTAVEPFVKPPIDKFPQNMKVVSKLIEETTESDIASNSIDIAYCSNVFGYPPDKLKFIQSIFRILKIDGVMIIPDKGSATNPPLKEIFAKAGLEDLIEIDEVNSKGFRVYRIRKKINQTLDFGEYDFTISNRGGQETSTTYQFQK